MNKTLNTDGISSIWPEINDAFLSLNDISKDFTPNSSLQKIYKELLTGFDSITSCEMKDFYKFKIVLAQMDIQLVSQSNIKHIYEALTAWVNFDYETTSIRLTSHIEIYPTDVIAIFFQHMLNFCTGKTIDQFEILSYCYQYIPQTHYLYAYYLAIHSFVLCEKHCFDSALELGLESIKLKPKNIYGIHAVTHVLHELEKWKELCDFLNNCKVNWIDNVGMRMHVYWHLAIAYERLGEDILAIRSFKELYALKDTPFAKQDLDAVGFLWRLRLKSADKMFENIWQQLATLWTGSIGTSISYFHKIHAALAFSASQQTLLIEKMIAESDGFGIEKEAHIIGLNVLNAILFFSKQQYAQCHEILVNTCDKWQLLGGSHAQREILTLTMNYNSLKLANIE